ncbi:MAG: T9SS type A sorting domain-containing protein [Bacteroidetes bacterium]|nr:MAG: T9SS type A sorting domain-containing protein [Bacteroidota bacterium]
MDHQLNSPSQPSQREGGGTTRLFFRVGLIAFSFLVPSLLKVLPFGKDLGWASSFAQNYTRIDTIPVKVNGNWLKNPWTGGHNYIQLSDIDMNFDGKKDIFIFDRTGHKVTAYINKGTPNTVAYIDSSFKYASKFPRMEDWAILRDYNCDGKPDIFTYAITMGGVKVWKNTSSGGNLQFTLQTIYIKSDYTPTVTTDPLSNLYVTRVDIPTVDDIDGDGDLDVLTFDYSSIGVEFHINKSKELGYNCDSLIFILDPNGCWGNFEENGSNCSINLNACRMMNPDSAGRKIHENKPLHTGSCSLCLDMNADGVKEIILGDISCCNMTMLTNSGSPTVANITAKDTVFPSADIPVNMNLFPCGYFVDVDNDNKRDLIVCPNAPNASIDNESVWFYKNTGADNAPVFSRIKRNLFQDEMIEVGEGSDPTFFDFNADGLTDLLVSNYAMIRDSCPASPATYGVYAYKNIGTLTNPQFELVDTDYEKLSIQMTGVPSKHLTFGDVDNDGDKDLFVGDYNGFIHQLDNTAGPGAPADFLYMGLVTAAASPIDIGSNATPQLIDVDRDSDLDLIIGERSGNLNLYENIGTAGTPTFSLATATFGGVDVKKNCCTGYSVPFMYDSAGKYNLMVSSEANRNYPATGWIWYYKDIDANLGGNFTLADSLYKNIWEGDRMIVHGKDINGDGAMDLAIGNYAGGVTLYLGDSSPVAIPEINSTFFDFTIYPNPSTENFSITLSPFVPDEKYTLTIFSSIGEMICSRQITRSQFKIEKRLSSGIYLFALSANNFSKTKKLVVLK